jgi:hypothetical protein
MRSRSLQSLIQMTTVLVIVVAAVLLVAVWRWPVVRDVFLADWKSILLNGVIVLVFALGLFQLYRGFTHYALEEQRLARFESLRAEGRRTADILADPADESLLAARYRTIQSLFDRGVPIDHGAIAAISVAEESLHQSFPRFVNNVLILTGVFGTVSSLIFALIGASDVLRSALPGEGMGLMLLGMNTALTTTATAIVCFFLFTYFYQKLTDVQTFVMSRVERAVLLHVVPEFSFESETVDHQSKLLLNQLGLMVDEIRSGVATVRQTMQELESRQADHAVQWQAALTGQQEQQRRLDGLQSALEELRRVLLEGFRLRP